MIIWVLVIVMLADMAIGAFAQTTQPATPLSASAAAPLPPLFQSLRYEEDWSYLEDRSRRSEWLDRLKHIPLDKYGWYLSLGGEARIRYEYFDEFNFGAGPEDEDGYLLLSYLACAGTHFG